MPTPDPGSLGIYIHWPFCQAKCPYCDFNSHVSSSIDTDQWKKAYLSEIIRLYEELPERVITSVFFGGGTPSLMDPRTIAAIVAEIRQRWAVSNTLEVTLEANPTSVEAARFRDFKDAGVNRVSVGVQALNDADLKRLGRLHSAQEALAAVEAAQSVFERVSFDLIYARQFQTPDAWNAELIRALGMGVDHLSLYQLTIEPNTAFGDRFDRGRLPGLVEEDPAADMYDLTQDLCEAAGMPAYEVSNHAKDLAQSRHNLIYWRGGDYAGIGPGAHGRLTKDGTRWATDTPLSPQEWLKTVDGVGSGEKPREILSQRDRALEYILMSMRLAEGMQLSTFQDLLGRTFNQQVLDDLTHHGFIQQTQTHICATQDGRRILNAVISALTDDLSD